MNRIGLGQDSHAFEKLSNDKRKPLILGGVIVSKSGGLKANSDGDVILHSLCNALSSAIGGDSLGTWADEMCLKKGITNSRRFIESIFNRVKKMGYIVENLSIAVEAKKPRISLSVIYDIKKQIANLLKISIEQIGITFTSGEGLTVFGKGEAIQVFTIVNLFKNDH